MTVSSSTDRATFLGNGVAQIFPLPFRFFANSEIQAWLVTNSTGALTVLSLGTHYTLSGAGDPEVDGNPTSELTMLTAPTALQSLFVQRVIPATQPTDIVNQGRFFPEIHENVFDRLTMLMQQVGGEAEGAIRVAVGDPEPSRLVPAAQRANFLMAFDSQGNPIAVAPANGSASDLAMNLANTSDPAKGAGQIGRGGQVVSSIAGLRALLKTSASKNAFVAGYYTAGDGGGGLYYLDAADTTSADNGGTVIVAADGGRWKLATKTPLTPLHFGAVANGVDNDRAAISAMFATVSSGYRNFDFLGLSYFVGIINTPDGAIFRFTQIDGLRITGMPKMLVTNQMTGDIAYQSVFEFVDCSDLEVECDAEGDVFNPTSPNSNGVVAVQLKNDLVSASGVKVRARVKKGIAALHSANSWGTGVARTTSRPTYSDIVFDIEAEDASYGTRMINCGFNVNGRIRTKNVSRSYFPVGVHNHTIVINSESQRNFMDVLIKAFEDPVSNIYVTLNQRNSTTAEWPVCIEHQNDGELTSIRGVSVHLNLTGRTTPKEGTLELFCVGRALTLAGAVRASTNCITDNISLSLNGTQSITSTATLVLPTKANTPSRIQCNFDGVMALGSSGYTIYKGDSLHGSTQGAPNTNPVKIKLGSIFPCGGYYLATLHGNRNVSDTDCTNALTRVDLLRIAGNNDGNGTAVNVTMQNDVRGTSFDFTYSLAGGVLSVSSTVTDATAIMAVTLTPLGGRFL